MVNDPSGNTSDWFQNFAKFRAAPDLSGHVNAIKVERANAKCSNIIGDRSALSSGQNMAFVITGRYYFLASILVLFACLNCLIIKISTIHVHIVMFLCICKGAFEYRQTSQKSYYNGFSFLTLIN